jgi:hypothetical protein
VKTVAAKRLLGGVAVLAAILSACRFGGPTGSADEYVAFPDAASTGQGDAGETEPSEAADTADAAPFVDASMADAAPFVDASMADAAPSIEDAPRYVDVDAESTSDAPGLDAAPTDATSTDGSMPVEAALDGA